MGITPWSVELRKLTYCFGCNASSTVDGNFLKHSPYNGFSWRDSKPVVYAIFLKLRWRCIFIITDNLRDFGREIWLGHWLWHCGGWRCFGCDSLSLTLCSGTLDACHNWQPRIPFLQNVGTKFNDSGSYIMAIFELLISESFELQWKVKGADDSGSAMR